MTLAIIFVVVLAAIAVIWVACYRKAKKTQMDSIEDVVSEAFSEPSVTYSNDVTPSENSFENCKTVTCCPDAANPVDVPHEAEKKPVKKEAKPRKTKAERLDESIAKLEGQIGRRTTLLKQVKKPVTKDERLNTWKAKRKELKSIKVEIAKAAKTAKKSKATKKAKTAKTL